MLIKKTQKKGFSIVGEKGEAILDIDAVTIVRKDSSGDEYKITSPGEYDVAGISTLALEPFPQFVFLLEGFTIAYLPQLPEETSKETLVHLEQADILIIPGKYGKIVSQIAPSYVIPSDDAHELAKTMGVEIPIEVPSLKLNSPNDLSEETEIVYLG